MTIGGRFRRWTLLAAALAALAGPVARAGEPECPGRDLVLDTTTRDVALVEKLAAMPAPVNGMARFWRITAADGVEPSWLLGTAHLTDRRVTNLPPDIAGALDQARILAVENVDSLDPNPSNEVQVKMLPLIMYTDGRNLRNRLTEAEFAQLGVAMAARGIPAWAITGWRPWAVYFSALAYPPCEMKRLLAHHMPPLDGVLLNRARAAGKPVTSLEVLEDQLGLVASVDENVQVALVRAALAMEPLADDLHETSVRLYLAGATGQLLNLSRLLLSERIPGTSFDDLWSKALDERNARMLDHARPLIDGGNAFLAVGAGHLLGEKGLVMLLRQAGYQVDPVR